MALPGHVLGTAAARFVVHAELSCADLSASALRSQLARLAAAATTLRRVDELSRQQQQPGQAGEEGAAHPQLAVQLPAWLLAAAGVQQASTSSSRGGGCSVPLTPTLQSFLQVGGRRWWWWEGGVLLARVLGSGAMP